MKVEVTLSYKNKEYKCEYDSVVILNVIVTEVY